MDLPGGAALSADELSALPEKVQYFQTQMQQLLNVQIQDCAHTLTESFGSSSDSASSEEN